MKSINKKIVLDITKLVLLLTVTVTSQYLFAQQDVPFKGGIPVAPAVASRTVRICHC